MAKKKAKKAAASAKGPVVCFFFYGSIEELGEEMAKFAEKANIAEALAAVMSQVQVQTK